MPLARLVVLFLAGAGCFLSAQTTEKSNLTLRVQDDSLAFIPNATIHVVSAAGAVNELRSDVRGQAEIRSTQASTRYRLMRQVFRVGKAPHV